MYDPTKAMVFISNDGGYTWMVSGGGVFNITFLIMLLFYYYTIQIHNNLTGMFSYGIADYGNIIAIVSNNRYAKTLW